MKRLAWITLAWLAIATGQALAQDRAVSYSTWIIADNMVTLRFVLPVTEAQRLTGAEVPLLTISKLEDYLLAHLAVHSAGGECPAIDQGFDLGRVDPLAVGAGFYGFEIFYRCADPRHLVLHNSALFGVAPGHVNFAAIQRGSQNVRQLFTAQHQELPLPDDRPLPATTFGVYVGLGLAHILHEADRWCFVLGLLLLVRRWRDLGALILALGAGYLLALLLAMAGWVLPRPTPLESFVAFLVALLGAVISRAELRRLAAPATGAPAIVLLLLLLVALVRSPSAAFALLGGTAIAVGFLVLSRDCAGRPAIWPALGVLFGFVDGFVLPAVLPAAQLPQGLQLKMISGFDVGALLSDALLLGLAAAAWLLLRLGRIRLPQALLQDVCAAGLSGLGAFWLLSRLG